MIPSIENIVEGLLSGEYTKSQCIGWLHQHAEEACRSLRDDFAAVALPSVIAAYIEANGRCIGTDHVKYNCAALAFQFASAMIAERDKP